MLHKKALFFFLTTLSFLCTAQSLVHDIECVLAKYDTQAPYMGTLLVGNNKEIIYQQAFGYAYLKQKIKNKLNTRFLIGSLTKQFTAVAILKLVEEKKVDLHTPINYYIPEKLWGEQVPEWAKRITIHYLLTHQSGLPEYIHLPSFTEFFNQPRTSTEFLQFIAPHALNFYPGEKYEYIGTGYIILGIIIEQITRLNYSTFMEKTFFKPLGMKDTYSWHKGMLSELEQQDPYLCLDYEMQQGTLQPCDNSINMSIGFAESSIISTAQDIYLWNNALYNNKILSKDSLHSMLTPQVNIEKDLWYGYGIFIVKTDSGLCYTHGGRIMCYESRMLYKPDTTTSIIALSNLHESQVDRIVFSILDTINSQPVSFLCLIIISTVIALLVIILLYIRLVYTRQ